MNNRRGGERLREWLRDVIKGRKEGEVMIILCPKCGTNLILTVVIRDGKESIFHSCPKCTCELVEEAAAGGEGKR